VTYGRPRPLTSEDTIERFACRSDEQTALLRERSKQSAASGTTRIVVVTPTHDREVVAYYAWTMASITVEDAPERFRKGAGRYPQPVALLARLGVSVRHEGRDLGRGLLSDVISRAASLSEEIGCRGLLVHAESDEAKAWYEHVLPDFDRSPTDQRHLLLLMKDIRKTLRG
jgi:hypothetical protein